MLTITAKYLRPAGKRGARVRVESETHTSLPSRTYSYPHDAFDAKRHCIREYLSEQSEGIAKAFKAAGFDGNPTICWTEIGVGGREISIAMISFPEEHEILPAGYPCQLLNWDEDYIRAVID